MKRVDGKADDQLSWEDEGVRRVRRLRDRESERRETKHED